MRWAVGYEVPTRNPYQTLIEHWDGKAWTIAQNGTYKGLLSSVAEVASDDVWAVGSTDYVGKGLIEHWDGKAWTETMLSEQVYFRAVAALSKNDVWAVGQRTNSTGVGDLTYAVHFDGIRWTHIPTPSPFRLHDLDQDWLTSLTALSSNDVWRVRFGATETTASSTTLSPSTGTPQMERGPQPEPGRQLPVQRFLEHRRAHSRQRVGRGPNWVSAFPTARREMERHCLEGG
jgi:hypothetical protein